jgi:hypothetical protein
MSNAFEMKELNARPPKTETESYPVTPVALIDDANDGVMTTWTIVNSLLRVSIQSILRDHVLRLAHRQYIHSWIPFNMDT